MGVRMIELYSILYFVNMTIKTKTCNTTVFPFACKYNTQNMFS